MRSKVSKENMERKARNSLMIAVIVIISAVVVCSLALSIYYGVNSDRFSGYVYEAGTNTPLAGVAVTNGHDVVKTDEQGRFVIDGWYKTRFITVTIPSGYWTENYYIETTRAKKGYDFYLDKQEKDLTDHSFLQVTDTEINSEGAGAWVDEVRDTAKEENAAFIIHTGDICYEDGLKQHIKDMNTQNMGVPVRYVIGNHDYVKWGKYSEDLFESTYGPVNYSFDVGNIHYVVTAITKGDYPARYQRWDVWRWLANDLAQVSSDKKVVIFNHDYCPDENGFVVKYGASKLDLRRRGLIAWVFGHWHYSYLNDIDGILNVTTSKTDGGGIDSTPAATRVMSFKGNMVESSKLIYRNFKESSPADGFEWTTKLDGGHGEFAPPIYADGKVYVGTVDDGYPKKCAIYALDAEDGQVLWKYPTKNSIRNAFEVKDGQVVAQDVEGKVYCLDSATGKEIWTYDTGLLAAANTGQNVVVDGDKVYCGGSQKTYCLTLDSGKVVWNKKNARANSSPTRMVIDGDRLLVGSHWDELIAYNKNNGKRVWDNSKDGLRYRTTTPAVVGDSIYVAAGEKLFELNKKNGKIIRSKEVGINLDTATAPYIKDGIGYFATAEEGVAAFDMSTFEKVAQYRTGDSLVFTSPYLSGEIATVESSITPFGNDLVFGASDGYIYRLDSALQLVSKYQVSSPVISQLAVIDDFVISLDFSGYVTKVRV